MPAEVDVRMRAKLSLQQIQSIDRDVCITLRDIEVNALQFLRANGVLQ